MAHTFNLSAQGIEADRFEFKASLINIIPGQPELGKEILTKKNKQTNLQTNKGYISIIPEFGRLRQEDYHNFKAIMDLTFDQPGLQNETLSTNGWVSK